MTRQHWIMVLLVVAIVGLIGFTVRMGFSSAKSESITVTRHLACAACSHHYEGEIRRPPIACPKCGKEAVWPAMKCAKCGTIAACDVRKFRGEGRDPYCPKCSNTEFTPMEAGS